MPLFNSSSGFDGEIENATSEYNTTEDWQLIMDICDKIKTAPNGPKDGLRAIMKRISHKVPHVSMQALTLMDACVNNCGKPFHLEISSRDWIYEARGLVSRGHPKVAEKLKELIEQWAEEFKSDPQLNLLVQFYKKLKSEGESFGSKSDPVVKAKSKKQELEFKEDLDLAIALSLNDSAPATKAPTQNLYPSASSAVSSAPPEREPLKARALYDFEAAEDNELSFKTGEIILVSDNSDQNWWKGEGTRGVGLFPANFVTTDLNQPPPEETRKEKKKKVRFSDESGSQQQPKATKLKTVISEERLETCLAMLKNASPTEEDDEEETIRELEDYCAEMAPMIQNKIEGSEKKQTDLDELNQQFIQAITLYQQSMKEPIPAPTIPVYTSNQPQYQPVRGMPGYPASPYQSQAQQQMYAGGQLPVAGMQGMQYAPASASAGMVQAAAMDPGYPSQGPASMTTQQQYAAYQQAMQNAGYQDAGYYTATSSQDSYAQSQQQGTVYDYNMANQPQQQHGQMYSQATVYQ